MQLPEIDRIVANAPEGGNVRILRSQLNGDSVQFSIAFTVCGRLGKRVASNRQADSAHRLGHLFQIADRIRPTAGLPRDSAQMMGFDESAGLSR